MKDWMDKAWLDFVKNHEVDASAMPADELALLKNAWLDGARKGVAEVRKVIDATTLPG